LSRHGGRSVKVLRAPSTPIAGSDRRSRPWGVELSFGADFQFELPSFNLPIQQNFFYVSPYYQTDYINEAQIGGVNVAWEPVVRHVLNDGIINQYVYFYTSFRPEADFSNVSNPGLTLQTKGEHAWLGETLRPNLTLFPLVDAPTSDDDWLTNWVRGRLSLIGTQKYFWDPATKRSAQYYQAIVQYKLGACKVDPKAVAQSQDRLRSRSNTIGERILIR
jgi:hypothetical protein